MFIYVRVIYLINFISAFISFATIDWFVIHGGDWKKHI